MAIQYIGVSVNGGTGGGAFVAWPTHQTGDLGVIIQECSGADTPGTPTTGGTPWTLIETETDTGTAAGSRLTAWWRIATSAAEANPTIPDPGDHQQVGILVFRNVDATTPVEASATRAQATGTAIATFPAVTTLTPGAMLVCAGSSPIDTLTNTYDTNFANVNLASMTLAVRTNTTQGNGGGFAVGYGIKTAPGDTGTSTVSLLSTFTQALISFALRDEAAVPPAPTNPTATPDSDTQITVDWDDTIIETGFRVERSPNGTTGWADVSGNLAANTLTYSDTGLTCNTQYFYRVFAFNASGDSAASSTVNATTNACSSGGGGSRMGGTGAIRKPPRNVRR